MTNDNYIFELRERLQKKEDKLLALEQQLKEQAAQEAANAINKRLLKELQAELERRQLEATQEPIDESLGDQCLREGERHPGQDEFDAELGKIFSEHLVAPTERRATSHPAEQGSEYLTEKADEWNKEHMPGWVDEAVVKHMIAEKPCGIGDVPDEEPTDGKDEPLYDRLWVFKGEEAEALEKYLAEKLLGKPMEESNLIISDGKGNSLGFNVDLPLSFEAYQTGAKKTAIYNKDARVMYPALGLAGEVGELGEKVLQMAVCAGKCANQVKKIIRDDDCECDTPRKHAIGKEIGGILWYCAAVASDIGLSLADIAQENLDILADRKKRGVIQGSGDNR